MKRIAVSLFVFFITAVSLFAEQLKPLPSCDHYSLETIVNFFNLGEIGDAMVKVFEADPGEPAVNSAYLLIAISWGGLEDGGSHEWRSKAQFKEVKAVKPGPNQTIVAKVIEHFPLQDDSGGFDSRERTLTFKYSFDKNGQLSDLLEEQ